MPLYCNGQLDINEFLPDPPSSFVVSTEPDGFLSSTTGSKFPDCASSVMVTSCPAVP